jgi:hypothetical protein
MAASVSTGWRRMLTCDLMPGVVITAHATSTAQPKCSDGIAATWFATPWSTPES